MTGRKSKDKNEKKEIEKKPTKRELLELKKMKKDMTVMKDKIEHFSENVEMLLKKL